MFIITLLEYLRFVISNFAQFVMKSSQNGLNIIFDMIQEYVYNEDPEDMDKEQETDPASTAVINTAKQVLLLNFKMDN